MVSEAPPFWWKKIGWQAIALYPLSLIYGAIAGRRMARGVRAEVDCPIICVGNFTVGGAGKTPTAIALANAARDMGLKPGMLSRGYGGLIDKTTLVDPHHHNARGVGDEPLLLAEAGLTVIARNRLQGARKLIEEGADVIIMDDGFQSAKLHVDYALIVVDGRRGVGNGFVVPSGPVRAPLKEQLRHASALLAIGNREGDAADPFIRQMSRAGKPVFEAAVQIQNAEDFSGRKVLAFAGIADPEKFYRSLAATGAEIVLKRNFADHHYLDDDEAASLIRDAEAQGLLLVTTAKDFVRLSGTHDKAAELAEKVKVLKITMDFDNPQVPSQIIETAIRAYRKRSLSR